MPIHGIYWLAELQNPIVDDAFNKEFYTNKRPQSKHINAIKLDCDG